jgi:hypothetical protein
MLHKGENIKVCATVSTIHQKVEIPMFYVSSKKYVGSKFGSDFRIASLLSMIFSILEYFESNYRL